MMKTSFYIYNLLTSRLILVLSILCFSIFIAQAKNTYLHQVYSKIFTDQQTISKIEISPEFSELFKTAKLEYRIKTFGLNTKQDRLARNTYAFGIPYFKIIALGVISVLLVLIVIIWNKNKKHKKELQKTLNQLDNYKTKKSKVAKENSRKRTNTKIYNESSLQISIETLQRIKDKLAQFEEDNLFLDPFVSALTLATYCQTNVRYVSEVVNKHKGQSISTYINQLRIEYILSLLENDESYRAYKINRLAEKAGFSSPSKFSTEFKRFVGEAPSIYISKMSR